MKLPQILHDHFADPYHNGSCEGATHVAESLENTTSCAMRIELIVREGVVREAWFQADGCECCEGLASLLVEFAEGKNVDDFADLSPGDLLADAAPSSDGGPTVAWPRCCRLPLSTLQAALTSPLDSIDQELGDFSGPSLREEC